MEHGNESALVRAQKTKNGKERETRGRIEKLESVVTTVGAFSSTV